MPEIGGDAAKTHYEIIEFERLLAQDNLFFREANIVHRVHQHGHIGMIAQNGSNGLGDVGRGEAGGRDLVKQWLEKMMVLTVHNGDTRPWMPELLAKSEPAKARP